MKTYRLNSVMAGGLYVLGTVFGGSAAFLGGETVSSIVTDSPLDGIDLLAIAGAGVPQLTSAAFFTLLMGMSLSAMTIFLYPLFRKDSKELAMGMVLFRGAIEGVYYMLVVLGMLTMAALGAEYVATGSESVALQSMGHVLYEWQSFTGHVGSFMFILGALFLYVSFYRTRLIPRWLTIWGLIGVVPYWLNAALHILNVDTGGLGLLSNIPLAIQEVIMGLWLVFAGFNKDAIKNLD